MRIFLSLLGADIRLREEISLDPPSPTLRDVLRVLKDQYEGRLERFIGEDLSPAEGCAILVNGRNFQSLDRWETNVEDGDEITFTVMVAGG